MPDYQLGKIYKLSSPSKNLVYYGSTAQKHISTRISGHIKDYKLYLNNKGSYVYSFKVLECQDYKYELIEYYPCNNKEELKSREGWYIKNNDCVNKVIPNRTRSEWLKDNIEYIKERTQTYSNNYYQLNKETINQRQKEYNNNNPDKVKEVQQKYRDNNKDKIKETVTCECGCEVRRDYLTRHKKSQKHIKLIS